jgi:rhamnopyranosyl-N-acetylglucosaminyl-diphospho-decaprenol beta-1,3/1,4-galactofuranosyltransferase
MRVLAYIHTLNEADFVEQALDALGRQTRPPDAILIVDNASTDGTLDRVFPEKVTVIRNPADLGTSGSVRIGFTYASDHGFDWMWILDADSVPEPDMLEKLLTFFEGLPPAQREKVCFLNGVPLTVSGEVKQQPLSFAGAGIESKPLESVRDFTECDFTLWSGSLFRLAVVTRIGLPTADYVMDQAEVEYGYRARQLGFASYVVHNAVIHQDVGRNSGSEPRLYKFGPISLTYFETSPARTYYAVRNMIYFWLYQHQPRRLILPLRWAAWRFATLTLNLVLGPRNQGGQMTACLRGICHGVTGNIAARY